MQQEVLTAHARIKIYESKFMNQYTIRIIRLYDVEKIVTVTGPGIQRD